MNILNKLIFGNYSKRENADFSLELYSGVSRSSDETSIEIFSYDMNSPPIFNININGKTYNGQNYLFENIKSLVSEYATAGKGIIIHITYGNLNTHLIL